MDRIVLALCAGRDRADVIERIAVAFALAGMLWLLAAVFLVMEPIS